MLVCEMLNKSTKTLPKIIFLPWTQRCLVPTRSRRTQMYKLFNLKIVTIWRRVITDDTHNNIDLKYVFAFTSFNKSFFTGRPQDTADSTTESTVGHKFVTLTTSFFHLVFG